MFRSSVELAVVMQRGGSAAVGSRRRRTPTAAVVAALVLVGLGGLVPAGRAATAAVAPRSAPGCPAQVCVDVAGNQTQGPSRLIAQGFIHGVDATTDPALVAALRPQSWLFDGNEQAYQEARVQGAAVTYLLMSTWEEATSDRGIQPPWQDFGAYYNFVYSTVRSLEANGVHVDYWEVDNEPDGLYAGRIQPTVTEVLEEYWWAVHAIRAADPSARVVGPSLAAFNDQPNGRTLDLVTFLNYVAANHLPLDAVSWHEVGARANQVDNAPDPYGVVVNVAKVRALLAARPQLGHPAIVINEYGSVATHLIPGWTAGWIAALERAGVAAANRACWHAPDVLGRRTAECSEGGLDGLLIPGSGLPQAVYSVHRAYAGMTGARLATASTDGTVTAFATRDDASRTLKVLVGRHQSCTPAVRVDCGEPLSATPPPVDVALRVGLPSSWAASAGVIDVERIPNVTGPLIAPVPVVQQTVAVANGSVQVPLRGYSDGDAYLVTFTAA